MLDYLRIFAVLSLRLTDKRMNALLEAIIEHGKFDIRDMSDEVKHQYELEE